MNSSDTLYIKPKVMFQTYFFMLLYLKSSVSFSRSS